MRYPVKHKLRILSPECNVIKKVITRTLKEEQNLLNSGAPKCKVSFVSAFYLNIRT